MRGELNNSPRNLKEGFNVPYIIPFSSVEFCRVDGLDPTYKNTMYFANDSAQLSYFRGRRINIPGAVIPRTLSKQNMIPVKRVSINRVRVELPLNVVSKANYMIIRNGGIDSNDNGVLYDKEFFYAFITDYQYKSETVTEIEYEIDVIQSYLFDYEELSCMVEREHTRTDYAGEHIAAEPVDIGAIKSVGVDQEEIFDDYMIVIATAYTGS